MKLKNLTCIAAALPLLACGCTNVDRGIAGEWIVAEYAPSVFTSLVLERVSEVYPFDLHADSTFSCATDCNSLSGIYKVTDDSIRFDNIAATLMACENDAVERSIRYALPMVRTMSMSADSVLTFKNDKGYALLRLKKQK